MSQHLGSAAALAPIALVLALLALRVPSLVAGVAGLGCTVLAAVAVFRPTADQISTTFGQMGPTVLEVALILLGGVMLSVVMSRAGAQKRIAGWLERVEPGTDRIVTILLLVFGLTPFMESVTGFGLGVVITAPLLVRIGLGPVRAVVTGLLGLVLVPWGSLAPGTLVAAELGGQGFAELGYRSALLTLPVLVVSMIAVLVVLGRRPAVWLAGLAAAVVLAQWVALVGANLFVGAPPAGLIASLAVTVLLLGISRVRHGGLPVVDRALMRAVVPYLVLLTGILGTSAAIGLAGSPPGLEWLAGPAVWINIAALIAISTSGVPRPAVVPLVREALRTWATVAGNAVVFMLIGVVMAATGMAGHLASLATGAGDVFVALIPAIGALGGYLTGSNTGAAAMFSAATTGAAASLGADPLTALAGQNVAGSYAIIVSPPRVALAVGVVMAGRSRLPGAATRALATAVVCATALLGAAVAVSA